MLIGDRIRILRKAKKLSQADIQKRSGMVRPYLSRIENGHTVPSIETLQKLAQALEIPLYQLFYEGEEPPKLPHLLKGRTGDEIGWGKSRSQKRYWEKFRRLLARMSEADQQLLLILAQKMK